MRQTRTCPLVHPAATNVPHPEIAQAVGTMSFSVSCGVTVSPVWVSYTFSVPFDLATTRRIWRSLVSVEFDRSVEMGSLKAKSVTETFFPVAPGRCMARTPLTTFHFLS
eukprot:scaffold264929_cov30-Prasinocladus_malaysianus.AAC.1